MTLRVLERPPYRLGGRLTIVAESGAFSPDDQVRCEAIVEDGVAWPRALRFPLVVRSIPVPTSWAVLRTVKRAARQLVVELPPQLPAAEPGDRAPTGFALAVARGERVVRLRLEGGLEAFRTD